MEKKQIQAIIADNIRTLMNQAGLSSTELARKSKIAAGTISKIINGNMSITVPMALNLAEGLGVGLEEIFTGLSSKNKTQEDKAGNIEPSKNELFSIGILSINNKRIICIKDGTNHIVGTSELQGGLDLTETSGSLLHLIQEAIYKALPNGNAEQSKLKHAKLNLVTQSYEFEDTRSKFIFFAKKYFKDVILIPDWQLTYLADFTNDQGISLVVDKGVSLSYMYNGSLKKLGGWKFPVYDFGGENWLGVETIRHTIEAVEGYIPMSNLARSVLAKFNGKIEKITETCFKGADPDIYCLFAEPLLRSYFTHDPAAKTIIESGVNAIKRLVERADSIIGKQLKITINGSLADIYRPVFPKERLVAPSSEAEKAGLLADITREYLEQHGVKYL